MKKKVVAMIMLSIAMTSTFFGCKKQDDKVKNPVEAYVPVETNKSKIDTLAEQTFLSGTIVPHKSVDLVPKTPGKVKSVDVKVGDTVSSGKVIFRLDDSDIQKQVDKAKEGLDKANNAVQSLKTAESKANQGVVQTQSKLNEVKSNYDKLKSQPPNIASNQNPAILGLQKQLAQMEEAHNKALQSYQQIQGQVKQAEGAADQAQSGYEQAKSALESTVIKSTISGIVSAVNVQAGGMASNMQPSVSIVNIDKIHVKIDVTDKLLSKIKKGDNIAITIPSLDNKSVTGKVYSVSPTTDPRTQLYTVLIEVDNKKHVIKSGMFVTAKVNMSLKNNVMVINSESVVQKDKKNVIYIVKDGKAVEKEVKLGIDNGQYVEIVSGVNKGEEVITKGQEYVENGSKVKVVRGDA